MAIMNFLFKPKFCTIECIAVIFLAKYFDYYEFGIIDISVWLALNIAVIFFVMVIQKAFLIKE